MVTGVPPAVVALRAESADTVGTGSKANDVRDATGEVPEGVVTRTSTTPAGWAGVTTRTLVL